MKGGRCQTCSGVGVRPDASIVWDLVMLGKGSDVVFGEWELV